MKRLLMLLMLIVSGISMSAQNADLGISGVQVSPTSILVGQTGQIIVDVRNFGFDDITAGCAFVQVSVPSAICSITGINAGSNPMWTIFSSSLPAGLTLRNTGGILPGDANSYFVILNVVGTVNGGPLTVNTNSFLNPFDGACQALGDLDPNNNQAQTTIKVGPTNYNWTGATNTDWSLFSNWATNFVPTSIDNAIIPNVPNKPVLTSDVVINDISIDAAMLVDMNGKNFTINGAVSGTGKLKGSSASVLTIGGAAGTLNFDQTSAATRSLKSLVVTATGTASLASGGDDLDIYDNVLLSPGASFNFNNQNITLKSVGTGALQSAYIGNLTGSSLTNAGNMTIERYIATPRRAWHLLSARAVTGSQTIKQTWQENGGPIVPGVGTLVTSNLYSPTNGFDMVSNGASVLTYNQGGLSGPSWNYGLSNTNTTAVSSNPAYMVFVRGDRTQTPANNTTGPTVLRTMGTLTQGNQSVLITSSGTGRTLVGNPYASPIDLEPVFAGTTNLAQDMLVWDAGITGSTNVGGFRVVERISANTYEATPPVGITEDNTMRYIHAGQAFFLSTIGTAGTTDATVTFTESMKTANLSVVNPIVGASSSFLTSNLMVMTAGNVASLADGIRVRYDASYNANTTDDILKVNGFAENIASYREGKRLAVEKRPFPTYRDTIFLRLGGMGQRNYRFELNTQNFAPGFKAYLEDTYKGTTAPIDLGGNATQFDFSVTADAASANPDRFRIIFALKNVPVTSITVKAAQRNEDIVVDWKAANQFNMKHYEVEKSTDGTNFSKVATKANIGANGTDADYTWLDVNAITGDNYYRIRSVNNSTETSVSNQVKVTIKKGNPAVSIYPNPVTNRTISLQMNSMEKGVYQLRLITTTGQVVMTAQISHGGGNATQPVLLNRQIANGSYRLEITGPDKSTILKDLVIADQ